MTGQTILRIIYRGHSSQGRVIVDPFGDGGVCGRLCSQPFQQVFFVCIRRVFQIPWIEGSLLYFHVRAIGELSSGLAAKGGRNEILIPNASLIDHKLRIGHHLLARLKQYRQ